MLNTPAPGLSQRKPPHSAGERFSVQRGFFNLTPLKTPRVARFRMSTEPRTRHSAPTVARTIVARETQQPFTLALRARWELLCIAIETGKAKEANALLQAAFDRPFEDFIAKKEAVLAHYTMGFHTARSGIANFGLQLLECLQLELTLLRQFISLKELSPEFVGEQLDLPVMLADLPKHPIFKHDQWIARIQENITLSTEELFSTVLEQYRTQFNEIKEEYVTRASQIPEELTQVVQGREDIQEQVRLAIVGFQQEIATDFNWETLTEAALAQTQEQYRGFSEAADEGVFQAMNQTLVPLVETLDQRHRAAHAADTAVQVLAQTAERAMAASVLRLMPAISVTANRADEYGNLLHRAVRSGHKNSIKVCLQAGIDLDCRDKDGNTPFDVTDAEGNNILHLLMMNPFCEEEDEEQDLLLSDAEAIGLVLDAYAKLQAPAAQAGAGVGSGEAIRKPAVRRRLLSGGAFSSAQGEEAKRVETGEGSEDSATVALQQDLHFQVNHAGFTPLDIARESLYQTWREDERTKALIERIVGELQEVFHYLAGKLNQYKENSKDHNLLLAKKSKIEEAIADMAQKTTETDVFLALEALRNEAVIKKKRSYFQSTTFKKINHIYRTLSQTKYRARLNPETLQFEDPEKTSYQTAPGLENDWVHQFKKVSRDEAAFREFRDGALKETPEGFDRRRQLSCKVGAYREYPLQCAARLVSEKRQQTRTLSTWFVRVYATFSDAITYVARQLKKVSAQADKENLEQKAVNLHKQRESCLAEDGEVPQGFWQQARSLKVPRRHPEDRREEVTETWNRLSLGAALLRSS